MNITDIINPYVYAMKLRRFLYHKSIFKSHSVPVPVISIGNLSMGGTGKTPITLALAKYCSETLGKKTAIILRGYKRESSGYLLVSDGDNILSPVEKSGDEAQFYAQELQGAIVICDEDRVRGAQQAVSLGAEVILLDDGFQHIRLKRDLNILLINSDEGIPPVFPFGKGREPASAIKDADVIIFTNSEKGEKFSFGDKPVISARTVIGLIQLYRTYGTDDVSPEIFSGKKLLAFAGIACPQRFKESLVPYARSVVLVPLEDHAEYNPATLEKIIATAKKESCDFIATTTKDAVKMLALYVAMQQKDSRLPPLTVIHSEIEFMSGKELLFSRINDLLKK